MPTNRKIPTSDGYMIAKETFKGLPKAAVKVGKAIVGTPMRVVKGIKNKIKVWDEEGRTQYMKSQKAQRLKAIKSSIENKDYMYQEGDDLIYPPSIQYKEK